MEIGRSNPHFDRVLGAWTLDRMIVKLRNLFPVDRARGREVMRELV